MLEQEIKKAKKKDNIEESISYYFEHIVDSFIKKDWKAHNSWTLTLLVYTRSIPIYSIYRYHYLLKQAIDRHGIAPLFSWILEYGYRLSVYRTPRSQRKFENLAVLFSKKLGAEELVSSSVFIRIRNDYQIFSPNIAYSLGLLLFSNFGKTQSIVGYKPHHYLKIIALLENCLRKEEYEQREGSVHQRVARRRNILGEKDACITLAEALKEKLGEKGFNELGGRIKDIHKNGFHAGLKGCLGALIDDSMSKLFDRVERAEKYRQCKARGPQRSGIKGPFYGYHGENTVPEDFDPSFTWRGRTYEKTGQGKKANLGTGIFEEIFDAIDGSGMNARSETPWDGEARGNTKTTIYDENGNPIETVEVTPNNELVSTTKYNYDANGNWESTATYDADDRMTGFTDSQGSATFEHNADGTTTVTTTTTNEDGSTTTVTTVIDESGNEVSSTTTTSSGTQQGDPIDDYLEDPCWEAAFGDIADELRGELRDHPDKLDALIYPRPDDPGPSGGHEPIPSECLPFSSGSSPRKCTSVMLCLDGQVDPDTCQCKTREPGGDLPGSRSGLCARITCQEGYACDPNTGTCKSGDFMGDMPIYTSGVNPLPLPIGFERPSLPVMPDLKSQMDFFIKDLKSRGNNLRRS